MLPFEYTILMPYFSYFRIHLGLKFFFLGALQKLSYFIKHIWIISLGKLLEEDQRLYMFICCQDSFLMKDNLIFSLSLSTATFLYLSLIIFLIFATLIISTNSDPWHVLECAKLWAFSMPVLALCTPSLWILELILTSKTFCGWPPAPGLPGDEGYARGELSSSIKKKIPRDWAASHHHFCSFHVGGTARTLLSTHLLWRMTWHPSLETQFYPLHSILHSMWPLHGTAL